MLHFYIAVIRRVLEYAVPIWHTGLTADLSDQLETVQSEHYVSNAKIKKMYCLPKHINLKTCFFFYVLHNYA